MVIEQFYVDQTAMANQAATAAATTSNDGETVALKMSTSLMSLSDLHESTAAATPAAAAAADDAESLPAERESCSVLMLPTPLPPSISHRIKSIYSFTSDVSDYRCGVFGICEITHVIDAVECICSMVDLERYVFPLRVDCRNRMVNI